MSTIRGEVHPPSGALIIDALDGDGAVTRLTPAGQSLPVRTPDQSNADRQQQMAALSRESNEWNDNVQQAAVDAETYLTEVMNLPETIVTGGTAYLYGHGTTRAVNNTLARNGEAPLAGLRERVVPEYHLPESCRFVGGMNIGGSDHYSAWRRDENGNITFDLHNSGLPRDNPDAPAEVSRHELSLSEMPGQIVPELPEIALSVMPWGRLYTCGMRPFAAPAGRVLGPRVLLPTSAVLLGTHLATHRHHIETRREAALGEAELANYAGACSPTVGVETGGAGNDGSGSDGFYEGGDMGPQRLLAGLRISGNQQSDKSPFGAGSVLGGALGALAFAIHPLVGLMLTGAGFLGGQTVLNLITASEAGNTPGPTGVSSVDGTLGTLAATSSEQTIIVTVPHMPTMPTSGVKLQPLLQTL